MVIPGRCRKFTRISPSSGPLRIATTLSGERRSIIRTWNSTAAGPTTHPGESMMIYLAIRARAVARSRAAATSSCTRWPDGAIDPTNRRNVSWGSGNGTCVQRKADRCRWPDRGLPGIAVKEPGEGICGELLHQEAAERGLPLVRGTHDVYDADSLGLELLCQVFPFRKDQSILLHAA